MVIAATLTPSCVGPATDQDEIRNDTTLSKIQDYLDLEGQNGFSGVVVVKIKDKPLFVSSYGYADEDQMIPNSPQVAFDVTSLTKQFTAAAILKLEMQNKLSVSDRLVKFFPELPQDIAQISIHHLLTNTSGLPSRAGRSTEPISKEELVQKLYQIELRHAPGEKYRFSHLGFSLLGIIIEEVSGQSYESYLQEHLFEPAQMDHTGYILPEWEMDQVAIGYRSCKNWGRPMELNWNDEGPSWHLKARGGILSTALDMMKWDGALRDSKILDKEAKDALYDHYIEVEVPSWSGYYGYGWKMLTSNRGTRVSAHDGTNGRFYCDFFRYLEDEVTILVMSNRFRRGDPSMSFEIANCIFTEGYVAEAKGRPTECLDSLPDSKQGQLVAGFFNLLQKGNIEEDKEEVWRYLASHLINKYPASRLISVFEIMGDNLTEPVIQQVMVYDSRIISLEILCQETNQRVDITFVLDENEAYKIRGFSYDDEPRN